MNLTFFPKLPLISADIGGFTRYMEPLRDKSRIFLMADRGKTQGCEQFFQNIPDTFKEIATKCDVNESSLRKFRNGSAIIRRTAFNKISNGLSKAYGIAVPGSRFKDEQS